MGTMIERQWMKWSDTIKSLREEIDSPTTFIDFEYLYHRMKQIRTPQYFAEMMEGVQKLRL
jgi:hypothetical protein